MQAAVAETSGQDVSNVHVTEILFTVTNTLTIPDGVTVTTGDLVNAVATSASVNKDRVEIERTAGVDRRLRGGVESTRRLAATYYTSVITTPDLAQVQALATSAANTANLKAALEAEANITISDPVGASTPKTEIVVTITITLPPASGNSVSQVESSLRSGLQSAVESKIAGAVVSSVNQIQVPTPAPPTPTPPTPTPTSGPGANNTSNTTAPADDPAVVLGESSAQRFYASTTLMAIIVAVTA